MSRSTPISLPPHVDPHKLWQQASTVLMGNWIGGHTVPARTLYPHQWSWDAAFIAVGLAHVAPERAWQDLHSLFLAQWPDGRVPHIVFDPEVSERDYFPGKSFWLTPAGTTGIVQPPVHALSAWLIHRRQANPGELRRLYPLLVKQQHYLANNRDAGGAGLVSIVHPWESGLDNSPSWDEALSVLPSDTSVLQRHRRVDVKVAVSSHRPTDRDYARYISLALAYRDNGYQDTGLAGPHPFLVECPAFNALYAGAELALADIAEVVGADPAPHRRKAAAITRAMVERLYDHETGMFHVLDLRTDKRSPARCVSGLIPLTLPDLPEQITESLVLQATSEHFGMASLPLPSYDRLAADFDSVRYWRGPIWINMNWLMRRGLLTQGRTELAEGLRAHMLDLVARSGCFEYFHPVTGEGIGTGSFSWTAALVLDLLADPLSDPLSDPES